MCAIVRTQCFYNPESPRYKGWTLPGSLPVPPGLAIPAAAAAARQAASSSTQAPSQPQHPAPASRARGNVAQQSAQTSAEQSLATTIGQLVLSRMGTGLGMVANISGLNGAIAEDDGSWALDSASLRPPIWHILLT